MLIRSTWTLSVAEPTTLPRSYGLELVKTLHQRMGLEMSDRPIPDITYSGILGNPSASGDFLTFYPDEPYQLILSGLRETASKSIAEFNFDRTHSSHSTLQFLGAEFQIIDRNDEITSYEQLYHTLVANEPAPVKRFDLNFTTPTAFAQDRIYLPLPVPALMFRSWLDRWNAFAPVYLGSDELVRYLSENIALTRHRLQTRRFTVHRNNITGFTGTASLQLLTRTDPLLANVANLLIHYAQFAGTGIKTRLGMGQTQAIH
ncbi:CRISPR-associated protein Cas6 [filamentous cyanobacterium CCP1]|nr:CRISPR-associated protein Cas6 [filamentous cyanobacterium CCP2]PSB67765.1 CRISPR-associated protein Cas6 [filamentous cyanobacterium CCP1]